MSSFYDQCQRCIRHPHQRIVGVCSSCLQERLFLLIEPISPEDPASRSFDSQLVSSLIEPTFAPDARHGCAHRSTTNHHQHQGIRPSEGANLHGNRQGMDRPAGTVTRTLTMRTHISKHAHRSSDVTDLLARSSNNMSAAIVASIGYEEAKVRTQELDASAPSQRRGFHDQHRTSESDVKVSNAIKEDSAIRIKKKGSWFSMSKPKNSISITSTQVDYRKLSCDNTSYESRRSKGTDLEAIAETNVGEALATHNIENPTMREAVGKSSSWFTTLFKWPRSKSNLTHSSARSVMDAATDTASEVVVPNGANNYSPKNSIDAGRLSWDGARPNFKQLLKRIETRSKHQRSDWSPSPYNGYAHSDNGQEGPSLQKSKSVASCRASISIEMPKELMQTSPSPKLQHGHCNGTLGLEYDAFYDDRNLRRSRSWSRTWNRALSPIWGSRSNRRKVAYDSPISSQQYITPHRAGSLTPSHVSFKQQSVCVPPTPSSSYLSPSPLRRSSLAPEIRIRHAH